MDVRAGPYRKQITEELMLSNCSAGTPISKNFPQFVVIHTVKGFSVVNKEEDKGRAKGTGDTFTAQQAGSSTAILVAKKVG